MSGLHPEVEHIGGEGRDFGPLEQVLDEDEVDALPAVTRRRVAFRVHLVADTHTVTEANSDPVTHTGAHRAHVKSMEHGRPLF